MPIHITLYLILNLLFHFIKFLLRTYAMMKYYFATIPVNDKKLLHFKPCKLHQILCADKTDFLSPGHI